MKSNHRIYRVHLLATVWVYLRTAKWLATW